MQNHKELCKPYANDTMKTTICTIPEEKSDYLLYDVCTDLHETSGGIYLSGHSNRDICGAAPQERERARINF